MSSFSSMVVAAFPKDRLKQDHSYVIDGALALDPWPELYDMEDDPVAEERRRRRAPGSGRRTEVALRAVWQSVVKRHDTGSTRPGKPDGESHLALFAGLVHAARQSAVELPPDRQAPPVTAPWMVNVKKAGRYRSDPATMARKGRQAG